jgi:hypothetical protein
MAVFLEVVDRVIPIACPLVDGITRLVRQNAMA